LASPRRFKMRKTEQSHTSLYFLLIVIGLYVITCIINANALVPVFKFLVSILKKIVPILILVFALMVLVNWLISPQKLVKYLGEGAGVKGWLIAVAGGILSTGPIYVWYPLLNDMQKHGVKNSFIAAFLYNRAIKIPLLPLLIFYFGWIYTIILSVVMIIVSIFQGIIVEKIVKAARK